MHYRPHDPSNTKLRCALLFSPGNTSRAKFVFRVTAVCAGDRDGAPPRGLRVPGASPATPSTVKKKAAASWRRRCVLRRRQHWDSQQYQQLRSGLVEGDAAAAGGENRGRFDGRRGERRSEPSLWSGRRRTPRRPAAAETPRVLQERSGRIATGRGLSGESLRSRR